MGRSSKMLAVLAVNVLAVAWSGTSSAQETATASGSVAVTTPSSPTITSETDPKGTIIPLVLGGLGGAQIITGIILVAAAPDTPGNCNEDTRTCARNPGQSDASLREDQETAGQAKQMPVLGGIAIVSGTLFAATGLAMYFWYNADKSKTGKGPSKMVVPFAGPGGGGLSAVARF